tara:strand:+ start:228 stop:1046 length:819 start_codon:yes stop_codon:yes gene_type:complete
LIVFNSIKEFNEIKDDLGNLSFIPTMGNLHRGHISLIDTAKQYKNKVIASIYINKLQFNDKNDYLNYPKTIENDINILDKHGCDYVLIPDDSIVENILNIKAPPKSNKLCGQSRPGHFDGVLTILNKFFQIINPEIVFFGKKDYQQFVLVRDFIRDNNLNIEIVGVDTVRNDSGLALSSRNNLLSNQEKIIATELYKALKDIAYNKTFLDSNLIDLKKDYLKSLGINVDYLISCDCDTFEECYKISEKDILVAVAAYIGKIRLIDNIKLIKL